MEENKNLFSYNQEQGQYNLEEKINYIDSENKEVITKEKLEELDPKQALQFIANSIGIKLKNPNKNCKKCYGRGYIGFKSDRQPVPCTCIFNKEDLNDIPVINHRSKRNLRLKLRKTIKKMKKEKWKNRNKNDKNNEGEKK